MINASLGIVGCGVMGRGLAQAAAQNGVDVVVYDNTATALAEAPGKIRASVRAANFHLAKGARVDPEKLLSKILFTAEIETLRHAAVVVENVTENWEIKKTVYAQLRRCLPDPTLILVNTSAIPITRVAAQCNRPDRVAGVHFMNPVPLKPTVELIKGFHTSEETLSDTHSFLARIGKKAIQVNDSPGFVSNRVLMLTINEAIFLLQESVADAKSIDAVFKECFGHKMGPLETSDLIGNDTILYSLEMLLDCFRDPKFRPCPLLSQMVDAGLLGQKSGCGFYTYG